MNKAARFVLVFALLGAPLWARTAQVWVDTSGSVNRDINAPADEYLGDLLTHSRGIDRVEIYGFASGVDALRMPAATVDLSKVPDVGCQEKKGELIFSTVDRRQTARCDAERERHRQEREKALASISRRITGHLQSLETRPPSQATCVFQVLERCSMQGPSQICIVVTDGAQEHCPMPPQPSVMGGAQVIVVLVPKKGDDEDAVKLLEERSKRIRSYASRIIVVPLFRMASDLPGLLGK